MRKKRQLTQNIKKMFCRLSKVKPMYRCNRITSRMSSYRFPLSSFLLVLLVLLSTTPPTQGERRVRKNRGNPNNNTTFNEDGFISVSKETKTDQLKQEPMHNFNDYNAKEGEAIMADSTVHNSKESSSTIDDCSHKDRDCMGVCFGTAVLDACGTCGGHNESCLGCDGVPNSGKVKDCFGVCGGKAERDCESICGGIAVKDSKGTCCSRTRVDDCGICYGNNACADCNGDLNGDAFMDDCHICAGGLTGKIPNTDKDCAGVCFGSARTDDCNVCSGGTTSHARNSDKDCNGVCFGPSEPDICGVCDGDGTSCIGCDNVANSGIEYDICGTCGGDNSECCGPYGACNNMGTCDPEEKGCLCHVGWTGKECTKRQNLCVWQDCGEHGVCNEEDGQCACDQGFMGPQCQFSRCSGHGIPDRNNPTRCNCFEGYTGVDCTECSIPKNKDKTYICLLKSGENVHNRKIDEEATKAAIDGQKHYKPLRFSLIVIDKEDTLGVLGGWDSLTQREGKLAILPGSMYNGTVYGCDCQPAVPFEDVQHVFSKKYLEQTSAGEKTNPDETTSSTSENDHSNNNNNKKENDDIFEDGVFDMQRVSTLSPNQLRGSLDKIRISKKFVSHVHARALTATEASNFLNEIFDFFAIEEDALTGTPETVGEAVDDVKETTRNDMIICIVYFIVVISVVLVLVFGALVVLFFVTGGRFVRGMFSDAIGQESLLDTELGDEDLSFYGGGRRGTQRMRRGGRRRI